MCCGVHDFICVAGGGVVLGKQKRDTRRYVKEGLKVLTSERGSL
jgi:hypothetical protein